MTFFIPPSKIYRKKFVGIRATYSSFMSWCNVRAQLFYIIAAIYFLVSRNACRMSGAHAPPDTRQVSLLHSFQVCGFCDTAYLHAEFYININRK